jgi:uncharacterized protein
MSRIPLMAKATAVWLVENTTVTFKQIAEFCHLHELEVKGIADGDVATGVRGLDPITGGQLTREEIAKAEANPDHKIAILESKVIDVKVKVSTSGPRYTPVSRRGDRPDAIQWLLRFHPELPDSAIMKLVGTTKHTINAVRDRSHWNIQTIKPVDPVSLGICTQTALDFAVQKAASKSGKKGVGDGEALRTLIPASEVAGTEAYARAQEDAAALASANESLSDAADRRQNEDIDADSVFAKLKGFKVDEDQN